MKIKPLEASIWITLDKSLQEQLLLSGVVPVNDIYLPNWGNSNKINLYYGSYGSGKSVDVIDEHLKKAIEDEYFRCYFGRKVLETVRGTIFKTIVDRIKDLKLTKLFDFSDRPNGSMIITHKASGNEFVPFGANDSQSLKSIKDPSHFILEEMDQFSFEDFGFIYSRLRTTKTITQLYGMFNTERVYQSHWIRKVLFDGEFADQCFRLKANYYDNHFIDREDYLNKLRLIANGNQVVLNAIANGEWGMVRTGNEFWKQFSESLHVKKVAFDPETTIHVSVDENVNPYVTQTIWQINQERGVIRQIKEILSRTPNNNAPKAARQFAEYLRKICYEDVVYVYGDPSGGKRSTIDENNASFFDKYIAELRLCGFSVTSRVQRSAPQVALSGSFINDIYEGAVPGWKIEISDECFESIEDYLLVVEDMEGKMLKIKIKDKETGITYEKQGHISDTKRYFITTVLDALFKKYKAKPRGGRSIAV